MFGMAVAASVMADGGVKSSNTVGYMDMASATFKLITPVFEKIDGTAWTLADLKPSDMGAWSYASDKIIFYSGASKAFEATYLSAEIVQQIIDDSGIGGVSAVAGWYDTDDVAEWGEGEAGLRCYNTRQVVFGSSGFAVKSTVGVRFVGEVEKSGTTMSSASFQLVGNCSPKDLTLADIKPSDMGAWSYASDKIIFYSGASKAFEATYLSAEIVQQIIDDSGIGGVSAVAGWYDTDDVAEWGEGEAGLRCYNATQIPAGGGFAIKSNVGVVIPSAIAED